MLNSIFWYSDLEISIINQSFQYFSIFRVTVTVSNREETQQHSGKLTKIRSLLSKEKMTGAEKKREKR